MTSRERVRAAFRHTEPDRTPVWEKLVKSPLADQVLGRPSAADNFDYRMQRLADGDWDGLNRQTARDLVDLCKLLGFDMIRLYPNALPPSERPKRVSPSAWRIGRLHHELLPSGWVRSWLKGAPVVPEEQLERALRHELQGPPPAANDMDDRAFMMMREAMRLIAEEGLDLPVFGAAYTMGVATQPPFLLRWFATDRDLVREYYRRQGTSGLQLARRLVREGAEVVGLGGDFASDQGPMCSPTDYREFVVPSIRLQAQALRKMGVLTTNASDGNLWPVLGAFLVEANVDGFEEIDFAAGMDLSRLRAAFPRKTFVGNVDIRHTLTSGTRAEVYAHTRRCIEDGMGGGGHILMSSNCIHEGVRLDLFLAHLDAYREFFGIS